MRNVKWIRIIVNLSSDCFRLEYLGQTQNATSVTRPDVSDMFSQIRSDNFVLSLVDSI